MRILEALLLVAAALAIWFALFDVLIASAPAPKLQYISFSPKQYWWTWLLVLVATAAGYVATRRR